MLISPQRTQRLFSLSDFLRGEIRQNHLPLSGKGKLAGHLYTLSSKKLSEKNRTRITLREALWVEVNPPLKDLPKKRYSASFASLR
jgi:hypothetical protein